MELEEIRHRQKISLIKIIFIVLIREKYSEILLDSWINSLSFKYFISNNLKFLIYIVLFLLKLFILYKIFKPRELWPEFYANVEMDNKEREKLKTRSFKRAIFLFLVFEMRTFDGIKDPFFSFFHNEILAFTIYFLLKLIVFSLIFKPRKLWPEFFDQDSLLRSE